MKQKTIFSVLAAGAVTMGLLLGASLAQAEVIFSTDTPGKAVGITNLDIGGTLYNVAFDEQTAAATVYGELPGVFDFTTEGLASAAVDAVVAALNGAGALRVGEEDINFNNSLQESFNVGYGSTANDLLAVTDIIQANIDRTTWANFGPDSLLYFGDERTYATFTLVGTGNLPPEADANGPYTGEAGVAVSFDGSASSDPDGTIATYAWDFGDGNMGSGATPTHTYTTADVYNVTLTVTDNDGESDSDSTQANIGQGNQPPVADADGPYVGEVGVAVSFDGSASSDPDGTIETYSWEFGDGNTGSGATPTHTYDTTSLYTVTLTVTDNDGVSDSDSTAAVIGVSEQPPVADANGPYQGTEGVAVSFDGSASDDPDGTIETYAWDFGDGNSGSGATPTHTYTTADVYNVTLTVTDNDALSDSNDTTASIGVGNLPPVADANGPYGGDVGALISFDGSASDDPDGTIVSWDWRFGDGMTGTGPTPSHSYSEAGKYLVLLTVTDDQGVPDSTVTSADIGPVDLTGTVEDAGGTPLCALALTSGQFMFTCNPNGPYSLLDLPRETDGSVKRQVYVDGFFPNVETLQGSVDETVVMQRAGTCPDYNSFPDPGVFPESAGKRIDVSGTVLLQNTQTPVCAMVLGNGQFGFTCDGTGTYSANIPLDANGQYKLQVYAQGFAPMVQRFDEFTPNVEARLARASECQ